MDVDIVIYCSGIVTELLECSAVYREDLTIMYIYIEMVYG